MKDWFDNLEKRERIVLVAGAVVVAVAMLYLLVLEPLYAGVAARAERVQEKQVMLAEMERIARTIPRNAGGSRGPVSNRSLAGIVDSTTRQKGIFQYLKQNQPGGPDTVRVRFEAAPFDSMIEWLGILSRDHRLNTEIANIERTSPTGTANSRLTLERAGA